MTTCTAHLFVSSADRKPALRARRVHLPLARPARQEGVILLFTMIAIVLLLIASVALVRSFDTSLTLVGNTAFKRDLVNQAERGVAAALHTVSPGVAGSPAVAGPPAVPAVAAVSPGPLALDISRQTSSLANNYSAITLASDVHGIPSILLDDTAWTGSGMTGADITDSTSGVNVRYVIDRLCTATGPSSTATCAISALGADKGGTNWITRAGGASQPVYRISVRVTGVRNTRTYVQATISM